MVEEIPPIHSRHQKLEEHHGDAVDPAIASRGLPAVARGHDTIAVLERLAHQLAELFLVLDDENGVDHSVVVVVHSSSPNRAPAGVVRVLQKPLQLERLLATVHDYCVR